VGRLQSGTLRPGQAVARIDHFGALTPAKVTQLFTFEGLAREEVDEARAGDIVAVAGVAGVSIGDTIADAADPRALPPIRVEEPTLRMTFAVNTSPFAGRDGTHVTSRKLRERLFAELERDVALRVAETGSPDTFIVSGRGELHLAILVETLRREGYEFQVSRPEVIMKEAGCSSRTSSSTSRSRPTSSARSSSSPGNGAAPSSRCATATTERSIASTAYRRAACWASGRRS